MPQYLRRPGRLCRNQPENPYNPALDYGPCGSDYRHIENVSLVAKSNFNNHLNRAAQYVVNGWELAPLIRIQTGAPFNVTSGQDNSLTDVGNDRPNLVPGVNPYAEAKLKNASGESNREFLNPNAFQQVWQTAGCASATANACPALGTYGNVSRNAFYGPKSLQFDAQISRIFPIHESWTTTLRLEAYNVLNHPNFSNSDRGVNIFHVRSDFIAIQRRPRLSGRRKGQLLTIFHQAVDSYWALRIPTSGTPGRPVNVWSSNRSSLSPPRCPRVQPHLKANL